MSAVAALDCAQRGWTGYWSMTENERRTQMIGTLPPWKGISSYCKALFEGIEQTYDRVKFTGWKSLYPKLLYPGGDPKTDEKAMRGVGIERRLAWYDPVSWIRVGLDPEVDLIHAQWWSYPLAVPYVVLLAIGKAKGKRILMTVHNVEPHEQNLITKSLNKIVYQFADEYIVHSERNKSQLLAATNIDSDKINIISHPVIGPEKEHVSKSEALHRLDLDPDTNAILFFGNIRDYKGLDSLIEMIASINESHDIELLIAGKCWEEWEKYRALIDQYELNDEVYRYPGFVPEEDLELFFAAASAVALPYEYFDAQSGVAGLADHFGTVSIGYDKGGLAEQLDIVVTNRHEFEQAILEAVRSNVEKRRVTDDSAEKHVELYKRLLVEDDDELFDELRA